MRPEPGSPADWLRFAKSDLAVAQRPPDGHVLTETLCFHAQQAVEKSLKAVLLAGGVPFPRTHNLKVLSDLLPRTSPLPPELEEAVALTDYAVTPRYPGEQEPVTEDEYLEAVRLAGAVVAWAETVVANSDE